MGWCEGSYIANDVFKKVCRLMKPTEAQRKELAEYLYKRFSDEDADCWDDGMMILKYVKETE
jgi:hypothetical protein